MIKLRPKMCPDRSKMVGRLLLETSAVINIVKLNDISKTAMFAFPNFPYIDGKCQYRVANILEVRLNLDTKEMLGATLDEEVLKPTETMTLLLFYIAQLSRNIDHCLKPSWCLKRICVGSSCHVKLHAFGNWACDMKSDSLHVRGSIATIIYNYMGFTSFEKYVPLWVRLGILSEGWEGRTIKRVFQHGIKSSIWSHAHISSLAKYSEMVDFIMKTRSVFLKEFVRHKHHFPGCDGESLFISTVQHSLEHLSFERILEDPLWADVDCKRFGKAAEMVRVSRSCFVEDIPGLYFHKRFKGSDHPFYEAVYQRAAKFNQDLADNMDVCIVK